MDGPAAPASDRRPTAAHAKDASERGPLPETILSSAQITVLLTLSVEEVQKKLEEILGFENHQTCLKEASLLDFYVSGFWWAKEMNFTVQQISAFMTLQHMVLENIKDKQMPLVDNFKEFATALAETGQVALSKKEGDEFFSLAQATSITDYFRSSVFQHYKLYEFLFKHPREELIVGIEEDIEVIGSGESLFVAPLEEGMSSDIFSRYVVPQPAEENTDELSAELVKEPRGDREETQSGADTEVTDPHEGFAVEEVRSVLGHLTGDALGSLQMEISERLRVQEETYAARIDRLKES
ncbi:ciliary-associated calcium-binding coiled-coil protein 1 isoform X2 [Amia ocellicauda]|uniref:ciliary-associated calcium-binding coiled-coil protein 1 isoform X2 n=1 Tax=Amia ocellicauda TaxID=2972642 RepID=UPI003463FEA4